MPAQGYTLSGTLGLSENAAVDSDLNDVNQQPYAINDFPDDPQPMRTPVLLTGTVNEPLTGPDGNNYRVGDADDYFRVNLVAGQVVELEFAADPAQSDVDLYIARTDGTYIGRSIGVDSRFECVRIRTSGTYLVNVYAYRGASIYNLRIGAPGSAGACSESTLAASFDPGQLMALPRLDAQGRPRAAGAAARAAAGIAAEGADRAGPHLLRLPADASGRARALSVLAGRGAPDRARALAAGGAAAAAPAPAEAPIQALKLAKRLQAAGDHVYVQPNWISERTATWGEFPPNDRGYPYQRWHYEQINLPAAMGRITGLVTKPAQRPIVAVVDDGVVLDHPDLAPQLVSAGRAFVSTSAVGDGDAASGDVRAVPADQPVFHGTHVGGTIGAATYDNLGGAGVAPMAQILPVRVFPARGGAALVDIVQGMLYAAGLDNRSGTRPARRADVINLSLGGSRACDAAYQDAISRVRAAGVIVVAAAGNAGNAEPVGTPANCSGAIAVSATDAQRRLTAYSQTGATIAVAAPGGDTSRSTTGNGEPDGVFSDLATFDGAGRRQPSFGPMQGTSMATPHVAGVMALMRYVNPALTPAQVDTLLAQGSITDDLGTAGRDTFYGFGLINARKAVDAALASLGTPLPSPSGQVVAQPGSFDFGSFQSSATMELQATATTGETVASIASSDPAVTVQATRVDAATGLGLYAVQVDRSRWSAPGTYYPVITVRLQTGRTFTVQVTAVKTASGSVSTVADYGPVYVLLIDPDTGNTVTSVLATWSQGRYTWRATGWRKSSVMVLAGGDLDNDNYVCQRGEPCGAYPLLSTRGEGSVIRLAGDRADLNFEVTPLSGMSPQGMQAGGAGTSGVRRR